MPCNQYTFFFSPLQDSLLWARDEILHKLWVSHATAPTNKDFQTVDGQYGQKTCFYLSLCESHLWCRCILLWHKRRQLDDGLNHQKKKHLHDVHFEWQGAAAAPSQSMSKNDVSSEVGWDWICSISKKLCSWYKTSNHKHCMVEPCRQLQKQEHVAGGFETTTWCFQLKW